MSAETVKGPPKIVNVSVGGADRMEMSLAQFSVVVTGKVHNPTILNPDFLQIRGIVPAEWEWEVAEGGMTTPAIAVVKYKQGVTIVVEFARLQVIDTECQDPAASRIADVAKNYVTTLPHVRYSGVGINFQCVAEMDEPKCYLRERFLKPGRWDSSDPPLDAVGLRLVYPQPHGQIVLSLDVGEKRERGETGEARRDVLLANANFHRDCTSYPADEEVVSFIEESGSDWSRYQAMLRDILGMEWQTT